MCELLALNFNQPVQVSLSFRGFRHGGEQNPDGWGIARFEGARCQVFKEPIGAHESEVAKSVSDHESFKSKIFIGHVRFASKGKVALRNTHPFVHTFRKRDFAFAHNGTVDLDSRNLSFHPEGDTDSEHLFCVLLTKLSEESISFTEYKKIERLLQEFNRNGTMNLVFSEGNHLYVYRDQNGYKGLCMTERSAPFGKVSLQDEDWNVNLAEEKRSDQRGFVIATHKLTDEKWTDLKVGSLTVFKNGKQVYEER